MSKSVLLLIVVIGIATAVLITLRHDLASERARADALAERVAVLEPVERPSSSIRDTTSTSLQATPANEELDVERAAEPRPPSPAPEQPSPQREYRGSPAARAQVERLQAALAGGTPLQEYQIQALITAIDQVRNEVDGNQKQPSQPIVTKAEANGRLVQAAADILFESQLEKFAELLDRER